MLWCNGRCNFAISNKCNLLWNYIQVIKNLLFFHFALSLWFISSKTFPFLFELFVKAHRENPSTRWIGSGENQQKHPFHKLIDDIFILMHSYCQKCIALNWMFGTFFIKKEVTIQFWQREKSFIRTLCNGWNYCITLATFGLFSLPRQLFQNRDFASPTLHKSSTFYERMHFATYNNRDCQNIIKFIICIDIPSILPTSHTKKPSETSHLGGWFR